MQVSSTRAQLLTSTFLACALSCALAGAASAQSGAAGSPVQNSAEDQAAPDPAVVQTPAAAQEARNQSGEPVSDDEAAVEAVVVTGSRIRRDPTNAPTPLIQLNREELLQSGEANIVDYLADVPALQLSQVPEDTTGNSLGAGGLSLLNLRGLGTQRTLVLVDGRRHVPGSPGTSSVDVDTIPSLLIENIEVVTGAASAQYGADAVSGVVNFILRRNFQGLDIDGVIGQVNQDGQLNKRISGLLGRNFLNERLNVYAFAEHQDTEEVLDADINFFRRGRATFLNDVDPGAETPDGILDVVPVQGAGNLALTRGGSLTLSTTPRPSPTSDADIPVAPCPTSGFSTNCFVLDPGVTFVFNTAGVARPINFGTQRAQAGLNRNNVVGSPDALPFTEFQDARTPEQKATRFQTGANFRLTDDIQLFGEVKYVEEQTTFGFQPASFNVGIRQLGPNEPTPVGGFAFQLGLDNAFLDPAIRAAILNNRRPVFSAPTATSPGVQTGTVADPRALFRLFTEDFGERAQINDREVFRYVLGARGDLDRLGFIKNFDWELGYTYGRVEDVNNEIGTLDYERLAFAADAVFDVNNETGRGANSIVCRVQLLNARGIAIPRAATGGTYALNDQVITGCTPFRIFGPNGATQAVLDYVNTPQLSTNKASQQDVLAFASGQLWDFWGAGPIGFAVGAEYREETSSGTGTSGQNVGRSLFANNIADFPEATFDVSEIFGELRIPLLRDLPLVQLLELTATGRRSEYSTIGVSNTYGLSMQYKPSRDVLFRANYGRSVRAPNIAELFQPLSQTFFNFVDTCSRQVIDATPNQAIRDNRNKNCAALGVPADYIDPQPAFTNAGRFGGNSLLEQEQSDSYTASVVLTPRFIRGLSVVLDGFNINIENAIATLGPQALLQNCTDLAALNPNACALITRDPVTFEITDFVQAALNFASLRTRGIDFNARYGFDLADVPSIGRDLGRVDLSLRGTYLIRRQNFVSPTNPQLATDLDATVGNPRIRLAFGATYSLNKLGLSWEMDHQTSQEFAQLGDPGAALLNDPDNRDAELFTTGAFTTHDFSLRYDLTDEVRLRAGVVNAFDAEPNLQTEIFAGANLDQFDLFGRRFFVGATLRLGRP